MHAAAKVFGVQKLAPRRAGTPERHRRALLHLGEMEFVDHRRQDVRGLQIEIVERPVHVRRHRADEIRAVLPPVRLAELDARDLGDGVRFVRRFQRAREQRFLVDRLRGELRVDARTAQKQQLAHPGGVGRLDEVVLNFEVIQQEIDREIVVRLDAADLRGGDDHEPGPFGEHELAHRRAVEQVELLAAARDDFPRLTGLHAASA